LKNVTKQHTTIKIIAYLRLITEAGKREHVRVCFAALHKGTCTYVYGKQWMIEHTSVSVNFRHKAAYKI
jgi:hypothetical protein